MHTWVTEVGYLVGAYPAYPADDPAGSAALLAGLAGNRLIAGLELPFTGAEPPGPPDGCDPAWVFAVTAISGTVARNATDADFGLASPDHAGRRRGLDFAAALRDYVESLSATHTGAVCAVEIQSAPSRRGSAAAFADSLAEIATWDWRGALVTVEHCDSAGAIGEPQKGYLSLADEIAAVKAASGTDFGVTINWARSAIERRDASAPAEHLAQARASGVLAGLMFSGCADRETAFGAAWLDAHLPPGMPGTLLSEQEIRASWQAAGELRFAGVKMGVRPRTASVAERLRQLDDALTLLDRCRTGLGSR